MYVKYINNTGNGSLSENHSGVYITNSPLNPVHNTISAWFSENFAKYIRLGKKIPTPVSNLLKKGVLIAFSQNDFINPSSYKGFTKLYKCSGKPKFHKNYCGKYIGTVHMLTWKHTGYDYSINYMLVSKIEFLYIIKGKMIEEFPDYPIDLYDKSRDEYDREWEHIGGLNPQEKIILAMAHNEEPFPHSLYENDKYDFSNRVVEMEHHINEIGITNQLEKEMGYSIGEYELDELKKESIEDYYSNVKEGFDYGDWEMSDLYTRVPTSVIDHELYPVRVNCLPKGVRKKGKSPYDTKLGIREYRYHNMYQKPIPLKSWKANPTSVPSVSKPKYSYEKSEEERELEDYDLPDNFWEEIEMAYQSR